MSEWISVKDKLPDIKAVLDSPLKDPFSGKNIPPLYKSSKVLIYTEEGEMRTGSVEWFENGFVNCTHWMPLPEPPKEQNHD